MTEYCLSDCNDVPCQFLAGHVGQCFPINPNPEWQPLPAKPFNEVSPRLWVGSGLAEPNPMQFQAVLSLHAALRPMPAPVAERRWHLSDASLPDADELASTVGWVFHQWIVEERTVLIRCRTGLNHSGLVAAMTLISNVVEPADAIAAVRRQRSPYALSNPTYVDYLMSFGSVSDVL